MWPAFLLGRDDLGWPRSSGLNWAYLYRSRFQLTVRMKIILMIFVLCPKCFAGLAICRVATTSIMRRIVFSPRHRLVWRTDSNNRMEGS
jgi:hypothetical protein